MMMYDYMYVYDYDDDRNMLSVTLGYRVSAEESLYTGVCPGPNVSRGLPEREVCDCSGNDACAVWNLNRDCLAYQDYYAGITPTESKYWWELIDFCHKYFSRKMNVADELCFPLCRKKTLKFAETIFDQ